MKSYPHNPQLVLASQSRARRQLLTEAGLVFQAQAALIDEKQLKAAHPDLNARDLAVFLASEKAKNVSTMYPHSWVIGADQTLACEGEVFEKPETVADVAHGIARLQGREQVLWTAVTVMREGVEVWTHLTESRLRMKPMSLAEQAAYVRDKGQEVLGCLGCFQIEKTPELFSRIDGDRTAIQGLPMPELLVFLRGAGVTA